MLYILKGAYYILSLSLGIVVSLFLIKLQVPSLPAVAVGACVAGAFIALRPRKKPEKK